MSLVASPPDTLLTIDRDQDVQVVITLPAGSYLTGGAAGWALAFLVTHPNTGAAVITKTTGSGVVVTTAGSAAVDAVFTVTFTDTDILSVLTTIQYNWKFKRTDDGSEVNIAAGAIKFKR